METAQQPSVGRAATIKNIYLYLVAFVALMMVVFSTASIIDIVLRTFVFKKADNSYYSYPAPACDPTLAKGARPEPVAPDAKPMTEEECKQLEERNRKQEEENRSAQRQRDLVRDISMIVVGVPLFLYHWHVIRKKEWV